ncbi:MAG: DUF4915 domain-containing protein [Cyanobacteria bacterium P01_A01_bin.116]
MVFVNTSYSCLAIPDRVHSFQPLWKPDFISYVVRTSIWVNREKCKQIDRRFFGTYTPKKRHISCIYMSLDSLYDWASHRHP